MDTEFLESNNSLLKSNRHDNTTEDIKQQRNDLRANLVLEYLDSNGAAGLAKLIGDTYLDGDGESVKIKFFAMPDFPKECPWHPVKVLAIPDAIDTIFSPLTDDLPQLITLLKNQCHALFTVKYKKNGWNLLYIMKGQNKAYEHDSLVIFAGGPPEPSPKINKSCGEFGWDIPDDLKIFYQVHNGFGIVGGLYHHYHFDGNYCSEEQISDSENIVPFLPWYGLDEEDDDFPLEGDNKVKQYNPEYLEDEYEYIDALYTLDRDSIYATEKCNQDFYHQGSGCIPSINLLGFMDLGGDAICFARAYETHTNCPTIYWFHDARDDLLSLFFPTVDHRLTYSWNEELCTPEYFTLLKSNATKGKFSAQVELAHAYRTGKGCPENSKIAFEYQKCIAEQSTVEDKILLARMYSTGFGVKESDQIARTLYKKIAEQGHVYAQYRLACNFSRKNHNKQAAIWFEKAANQQHRQSAYRLGCAFESGDGVKQSDEKAFKWYKVAANLGCMDSKLEVAMAYDYGCGTEQSFKDAFACYTEVANNGDADAQFKLAVMYENGDYVDESPALAFKWFLKSAENDNEDALEKVAHMYFIGEGVTQSYRDATYWFKRGSGIDDIEKT